MTESGRPSSPPDPFALWRQTYEMAEQAWTKALEQTTGTDAFAASLGKSLDSYLGFQKLMRENMQVQLETLNLPTRNDIARLGELIVNLENKIDELDDRVERLIDDVAALRRARRDDPVTPPAERKADDKKSGSAPERPAPTPRSRSRPAPPGPIP